ncbi:hypothetical protein D1114_11335 [Cereibacter sphaeroides]|uniref:Uncharacterized protein n=1 Tax=Cereibacter sphaeroides TaxID=1063 RepID=A0AAX1UK23_CERSP|nr:hypothetical protein RSKD131_4420 [Cereibacter sphaeroides KD131]AXC63922.1 hypothetical protein DQL45_21240 [Cereibacter sphaeroides 2.4.1]AZB66301.1 hypothetical protein EBL87_21420 [Cereibacter sphaeroides]AZB71113.1 hypothetical protein EBL86_22370 [Cereibacter sphaeroides]RHZ94656.1 hypothetical protein D1114_11335 [Cereibacter sphaeroides]
MSGRRHLRLSLTEGWLGPCFGAAEQRCPVPVPVQGKSNRRDLAYGLKNRPVTCPEFHEE